MQSVFGVQVKDDLPHGNAVDVQNYADFFTSLRTAVTLNRGIARTQYFFLLSDNSLKRHLETAQIHPVLQDRGWVTKQVSVMCKQTGRRLRCIG